MVSFNRIIFQYVHVSQSVYPDLILVIAVYSVPSDSLFTFESETDFLLQFCHNRFQFCLHMASTCFTMSNDVSRVGSWLCSSVVAIFGVRSPGSFPMCLFLVGRDPAFDNFLPKINSMWCISGATMLILALRPEFCITLIAIGEAQKIMNRNSSQSCTLSSGEIGEYISTVTVLLACSKEYLTLLAPAT